MDDYLDPYFSSLSWDFNDPDRQNGMLPNLLTTQKDREKVPSAMGSFTARDTTPVILNEEPDYIFSNGFLPGGAQTQKHGQYCNGGQYEKNLSLGHPPVIPELWAQPASSFSPVAVSDITQDFGLCGRIDTSNNGTDAMRNKYVGMDKVAQFEGKPESQNHHHITSFASRPHQTTAVGLPTLQQNSVVTPTGSANGTGKPRVRARRGQATDPHSIAERVRREKIAERMRNLQELVPNASKTDKASMLAEIIDYVKFLQCQVKVLSMSRLGAAAAVVPLITDVETELANGLSLPSTVHQGGDIHVSPDQVAFEQEVVQLMESNLTAAMQHLQTKGLCLMPIALATAISNGKQKPPSSASTSSSAAASEERNLGSSNMNSSSSSSVSSLPIAKGMVGNGCNASIKQENANFL